MGIDRQNALIGNNIDPRDTFLRAALIGRIFGVEAETDNPGIAEVTDLHFTLQDLTISGEVS